MSEEVYVRLPKRKVNRNQARIRRRNSLPKVLPNGARLKPGGGSIAAVFLAEVFFEDT